MRQRLVMTLLTASMCACGSDPAGPDVDAVTGNTPPPRIIEGGGIGDGPIDGVANLYVIDDVTRQPIGGAAVRIGPHNGLTDPTGLFVARDVVGPQTVTVKAASYRAEVWVGANGANLTMNLVRADPPVPPSATLSGQITGFGAITVATGHRKDAIVMYAQTSDLGDPANEIAQPASGNACFVRDAGQDCPFTIATRTGKLGLIAAIFDRDLNGTPGNFDDDKLTVLGWATRRGITATAGATQAGLDLTPLPIGQLQSVTVDFGAPPSELTRVAGLIGLDLGDEGVFQLVTALATPAKPTIVVPRLDAVTAAAYRLTGIAADADPATRQSVVLRKRQTATTLSAGAWLATPTAPSLARTGGSWTNVAGATVHSLEYVQGKTRVVNVTVLDGSTAMTIPDLIAMPSGSLTATLNAIGAPGLDVTDFALDRDKDKLVQVGGAIVQLN